MPNKLPTKSLKIEKPDLLCSLNWLLFSCSVLYSQFESLVVLTLDKSVVMLSHVVSTSFLPELFIVFWFTVTEEVTLPSSILIIEKLPEPGLSPLLVSLFLTSFKASSNLLYLVLGSLVTLILTKPFISILLIAFVRTTLYSVFVGVFPFLAISIPAS